MKIKTSELIGGPLDWAVAKAEGYIDQDYRYPNGATCKVAFLDGPHGVILMTTGDWFRPSTLWSQGGPIIEKEMKDHGFDLWRTNGMNDFAASYTRGVPSEYVFGPTPLIAAMRCYVAWKLSHEVDIPKELL
jgi:hypothetical protein